MAKKKGRKAAAKPAPHRSHPRRPPAHPQHHGRSQVDDAVSAVAQRFSLRDEARWMSGHRSNAFDSSKKLRHMPITFISAGRLEGTVKETAKLPQSPPPTPPSPVNTNALAQMTIRSRPLSPVVSAVASDVSSEDEIVVFRGRGQPLSAHAAPPAPATSSTHQPPAQTRPSAPTGISSDELSSLPAGAALPVSTNPGISAQDKTSGLPTSSLHVEASEPAATFQHSDVGSDTNSIVQTHFEKRRHGRPIWEGRTTDWVHRSKPGIGWLPVEDRPNMNAFLRGDKNPHDAAMEDYMQNVEDFGLRDELIASAGFSRREMDLDAGCHNDWESDPDRPDVLEDVEEEGWNSDMLRDLDGISTSSDVIDTIARILSKRTRTTGPQYLVVYEGSTPDDARWLPASFLKASSDIALVQQFEAQFRARLGPLSSSSGSIDSDFDDDEDDEALDESDEELDDETIARVLQKQEELGLGSDELVLYAADEYFNGSMKPSNRTSSITFDRPNKRRQHRIDGGRRPGPSFPSASAMADALAMDPYAGFDIMDTERPSLRPLKKGRRGQPPPELDDSDLNEQLRSAWDADRAKKRLKKAEREELRQQGLLGRKGKAADLSVKYKDGVLVEDVIEEIRTFMVSDMQTLSLPPMEAHRRAVIHQFVHKLDLNSKSRGVGADRFMVLSKTRRTKILDDDTFDALVENKKFMNRMRGGPRAPGLKKQPKTRPTVSYKDGEVVGASAPELGPENKGRALMEKMGWSKGMALGSHDNKGILQPITHIVKTTKAGLQ